MEIKLIQPFDDNNLYAEFPKEHGEGLHYFFAVEDFDGVVKSVNSNGISVTQQGKLIGANDQVFQGYVWQSCVNGLSQD